MASAVLLVAGCGTSSDDDSSSEQPGASGFEAPDIADGDVGG